MRALRFIVPFVGAIAIVALGVAIYGTMKHPRSYAREIGALKATDIKLSDEMAAASTEIATLKDGSQAGQVARIQHQLNLADNTINGYKVCIPQLQQEINGMSIQSNTQGGFVTSDYLQNPTIISSDCTRVLDGNSGTGG